jgi:hypothetical protein
MIITGTDIKCSKGDCTEGIYICEFKIELARFTILSSSLQSFPTLFSKKLYKGFLASARKAELENIVFGIVTDVVSAVLDNLERCLRFYQWQVAAREALIENEFRLTTELLDLCAPFTEVCYGELNSRLNEKWHNVYADPVFEPYLYKIDVK